MSFGLQLNNLELSQYPVNYVDNFFVGGGSTVYKDYPDFAGLGLIAYPQLAQAVSLTSVYYPPSISISGTSVTVSGQGVDTQIYVFAR